MDTKWAADLPAERREDFKKLLENSQAQFSRLLQIIEDDEKAIERQETSKDDFETPSWALKQANRLGEKKAYRKVKDLLSFVRR